MNDNGAKDAELPLPEQALRLVFIRARLYDINLLSYSTKFALGRNRK